MKFVNLTPHTINFLVGNSYLKFESEGSCRVAVKQVLHRTLSYTSGIDFQIPLMQNEYGTVENLPEPQEGVFYIVSLVVLSALKALGVERDDVIAPDSGASALRENGQIVAIRNFVRI